MLALSLSLIALAVSIILPILNYLDTKRLVKILNQNKVEKDG